MASRGFLGLAFSASGNGLLVNFGGAVPMDYFTNPPPSPPAAPPAPTLAADVWSIVYFVKLDLVKPPPFGSYPYISFM